MRVLFFAPYIYDKRHIEFSRTPSGFGYMVKDILCEIIKYNEGFLITHQFTQGYIDQYQVLKHTKLDTLLNVKLWDICKGIKHMIFAQAPWANRVRYAYYYINSGSVKKCIDSIKPDMIHIHGLTLQTKPIIEMCEKYDYPYIVTLHGLIGLDDSTNAPQADKEYEYEALCQFEKNNQTITVISSGVRDRIINNYKLSGKNIHVILNGTYLPEKINKISTAKKNILCIGTVSKRKNQMQLLRVCSLIRAELEDLVKVHIIGAVSEGIDVNQKIEELGLSGMVQYHGFVQREQMSALWQSADYNIIMSKDEGFGLSIIEGYSYGVPTITFGDIDAVKDLYDENSMLLIKDRSDESVSNAIKTALKKQWDSKLIIAISKKYSMETIGKAYSDLYCYESKEKNKR